MKLNILYTDSILDTTKAVRVAFLCFCFLLKEEVLLSLDSNQVFGNLTPWIDHINTLNPFRIPLLSQNIVTISLNQIVT